MTHIAGYVTSFFFFYNENALALMNIEKGLETQEINQNVWWSGRKRQGGREGKEREREKKEEGKRKRERARTRQRKGRKRERKKDPFTWLYKHLISSSGRRIRPISVSLQLSSSIGYHTEPVTCFHTSKLCPWAPSLLYLVFIHIPTPPDWWNPTDGARSL